MRKEYIHIYIHGSSFYILSTYVLSFNPQNKSMFYVVTYELL